ncbi:MAG: hypothetical protein H5T42_04335 [Methanothrix sp.]|jgi:hypothetical protein|uniref:DUF4352 domain-containing protein n=1 Tax=Methanothrix thermoacetophila (strain DSM 6194 / JCM 14653 / NBRC 101360 / PT) TaxID=349307 RepID=A0B695_METTP|nr:MULTISPECIES: hypothetical protein [Methanothrix]ABK14219.1 hypothetical protein Mthe_0427 [Methanothrix thermoacetophila PT]MBC7079682.1 hypothetical protein [Methanothrix sp.]NPU87756.1 hypothetical protein [Methanothrix sp.]
MIRTAALGVMLILMLCVMDSASVLPVTGGNGELCCTVFDIFKGPLYQGGSYDADRMILYIDAGLRWSNGSCAELSRVKYILIDGNDRSYSRDIASSRPVSPGRELLAFVVPREAIPKSLVVDSGIGEVFKVDLGEPLNYSDENITVTYYGIMGSRLDYNRKALDIDISVRNNSSNPMRISPENCTLVDQWGWGYRATDGFETRTLNANESIRGVVRFRYLAPSSIPSLLLYNLSYGDGMIVISEGSCENTTEPSKEDSSGECNSCTVDESSVKGRVAAAKERLARVRAAHDTES